MEHNSIGSPEEVERKRKREILGQIKSESLKAQMLMQARVSLNQRLGKAGNGNGIGGCETAIRRYMRRLDI